MADWAIMPGSSLPSAVERLLHFVRLPKYFRLFHEAKVPADLPFHNFFLVRIDESLLSLCFIPVRGLFFALRTHDPFVPWPLLVPPRESLDRFNGTPSGPSLPTLKPCRSGVDLFEPVSLGGTFFLFSPASPEKKGLGYIALRLFYCGLRVRSTSSILR